MLFFSTLPLSPANALIEANALTTKATKKPCMKRFIFFLPSTFEIISNSHSCDGPSPICSHSVSAYRQAKVASQTLHIVKFKLEIWRCVQGFGHFIYHLATFSGSSHARVMSHKMASPRHDSKRE